MKKNLRLITLTVLFQCVIVSYAQNSDNVAATRNYADILISSTNVINPANAVNPDLTNYAVMQTLIGVANTSTLKLGWSNPGTGGQQSVVEIQNDGGLLTLDVLQSITLTLYNSAGKVIKMKSGFNFAEVTAGDDPSRSKIRLKAPDTAQSVASIKITVKGLASLENRIRIYYAYLITVCPAIHADQVFAQLNVQNANNAITATQSDFATLTPPISGNSFLDLAFSTPGDAGKNVGFYLGEGNQPLDLTLLQHITATVYNTNGGVVVTKSDFVLADAEVFPGGRFHLEVHTPAGSYQIGRGRITFNSFANVLSTLKVYTIITHVACPATPEALKTTSPSLSLADLQVYPNPFNSYTTLSIKNTLINTAHIVISDKVGNLIEQHEITGAGTIRLLEKAPTGIYMVKIISGDMIETRKVIKL